jgi:hypothetical protein
MKHDPARQVLAAAVAAASTADAAVMRSREVLSRAEIFLRQAGVRHVEAEEALSKALAEHGETLASAIASGASPNVGGMVRAARARLVDAEDELTGATAAFAKLKDSVQRPEEEAVEAKRAVEEAVAGVVAGHVDTLLDDAKRAQFEYVERFAVLAEIRKILHPWTSDHKAVAGFVDMASFAVHRHFNEGGSTAAAEWRQAVEALSRDATMRLPVPGSARLPPAGSP